MKERDCDNLSVAGHDRGARVAYCLPFDNPESLNGVVVIDIVPTAAMYKGFCQHESSAQSISLADISTTRNDD